MPKKNFFHRAQILITRTDRLGDVVLATPVLKKIREVYPEAKLTFLVQKHWMTVLRYEDEVELMVYDPKIKESELTKLLKSKKFDVALVLRDEKKVSWAIKAAKIPIRIGPYSSLRSFLVFNFGVLQKRSRCKMHEAEYNLELLTRMGIPFDGPAKQASELPRAWLQSEASAVERVREFMTHHGLQAKRFVCVHPGASGSARYLSFEKMVLFLKELQAEVAARQEKLLLTGGPAEAELLTAYAKEIPGLICFGGVTGIEVSDLAQIFTQSSGVIAHGTGPLHVAAAMGVPVFAIFPPLYVLSEKRWGPLTESRLTWTPPAVSCPQKYRCSGKKCPYFDCMDGFHPKRELAASMNLFLKK